MRKRDRSGNLILRSKFSTDTHQEIGINLRLYSELIGIHNLTWRIIQILLTLAISSFSHVQLRLKKRFMEIHTKNSNKKLNRHSNLVETASLKKEASKSIQSYLCVLQKELPKKSNHTSKVPRSKTSTTMIVISNHSTVSSLEIKWTKRNNCLSETTVVMAMRILSFLSSTRKSSHTITQ